MSIASILGELIAAAGAFLLVRRLAGPNLALLAAAVCWIFPPMAMDSSFWGQTDSWFIAPALFTIYFMIRGRWIGAGILTAVTILLKPQGLFLGPIVLLAAALLPEEGTGSDFAQRKAGTGSVPKEKPGTEKPGTGTDFAKRNRSQSPIFLRRLVRCVGAGAAALILLVLPWTIAGGTDWLGRAYVDNFTTKAYQETTLKAFNIWYLDALTLDSKPSQKPLDPAATIAGISKGGWGNLLVLAALITLAAFTWKRLRGDSEWALLWFSAMWLWSTFMWPTKVHERYIMYAIPLVVLCSFRVRRLWPAAIALMLVGSAELCHNVWLTVPPGYRAKLAYGMEYYDSLPPSQLSPREAEMVRKERQGLVAMLAAADKDLATQRRWEYLVLAASLLGYAWAFACPFVKLGQGPVGGQPPQSKHPPQSKRK
jgi:hypothetical protein